MFYNSQSNKIDDLTLESMTVLAEWNELQNKTNDLLLNRFTYFGNESASIITGWEDSYHLFGTHLEALIDNPLIQRQPDLRSSLAGAYRVWRYTEVRLNNASYYFSQIFQSDLGERVFVNGMLHTMYQLRLEDQLAVDEIILLEETIFALEYLDNSAREFDTLFTSIVVEMKSVGETYLNRIRLLFVGLFCTVVVILAASFFINRQLRIAQHNRKLYLENSRRQLLRELCENSGQETLDLFRESREKLNLSISLDAPVKLLLIQIDDFYVFSHTYNLHEQGQFTKAVGEGCIEQLSRFSCTVDAFFYADDQVVVLINSGLEKDAAVQHYAKALKSWQEQVAEEFPFTITITSGDYCFEIEDLDHDFEKLLRDAEYRYLLGNGSFITRTHDSEVVGAPLLPISPPEDPFRYPLEKERLFEDAFKSLNQSAALRVINEMIDYAKPYGPESVKRLIIRLTASQSSVIDLLEKSYHISAIAGVTPMILKIQKVETLQEAVSLLEDVTSNVIAACLQKKNFKHDHTVAAIKEIVEERLTDFNLSADQIADQFKLSASYINRLFKQQTSMSIAGYINNVRLEKAESLLQEGSMTVSQVAEKSGFSSMGTFFRLFKKKFGQTPGDRNSGFYGATSHNDVPDPSHENLDT